MKVHCSACSTTFVLGDDIVRVVRKRGGTVPCRTCKAPISIASDGPTALPAGPKPAEPAKPQPVEPARPKPAEPKPKPAEPAKPKPLAVSAPARVPAAPAAPKLAPPPVPAQRPAAVVPHAPPPPKPRTSAKTRSLPPPTRSILPKPPVPINATDEWLEAEPDEGGAAITLSASEFPPAAVVTLSMSEPPPPLAAPILAAKVSPPPLPAAPIATRAASDVDVVAFPPAPPMPSIAIVDGDASTPRTNSKTRIGVVFAAALLVGIGLVAVLRLRSGESDRVATPAARASVTLPVPLASVEAPSTTAALEIPAPAQSVEAPSPAASLQIPPPAASLEIPPPAAVAPARAVPAAAAGRAPETDLSSLQPAKPAKVDSRGDDDALQQALAQAAERAKGCRDATSPTGVARVSVTIAPSGDATGAVVLGAPFAHTLEGDCIAAKFRAVHVAPFTGDSINVRKSVSLQ